jgi:hypothetical protein
LRVHFLQAPFTHEEVLHSHVSGHGQATTLCLSPESIFPRGRPFLPHCLQHGSASGVFGRVSTR